MTDTTKIAEALRAARASVQESRDTLFACHRDPVTGTVNDREGVIGLREYDDVLTKIDDALAEHDATLSAAPPASLGDHCRVNGCAHAAAGSPAWPAGTSPFAATDVPGESPKTHARPCGDSCMTPGLCGMGLNCENDYKRAAPPAVQPEPPSADLIGVGTDKPRDESTTHGADYWRAAPSAQAGTLTDRHAGEVESLLDDAGAQAGTVEGLAAEAKTLFDEALRLRAHAERIKVFGPATDARIEAHAAIDRLAALAARPVEGQAVAQPATIDDRRVTKTAPERIWLDVGTDCDEWDFSDIPLDGESVTWSANNALENGIEYVRTDLAAREVQPVASADTARMDWLEYTSALVLPISPMREWLWRRPAGSGNVRAAIDAAMAASPTPPASKEGV